MYKIKIYKNGKLFAEYDLKDYMIMDEAGKAFVSTGETPQQFILNGMQKEMKQEEDSDVMEAPPEKEQKKKPSLIEKQALKYIISKLDKDEH